MTAALAGVQALSTAGFNTGWLQPEGLVYLGLRAVGLLVVDDVGTWCWALVIAAAALAGRAVRARRGARGGHRRDNDGQEGPHRGVSTASLLGLALFAGAVLVLRAGSGAMWISAAVGSGLLSPSNPDAAVVWAAIGSLVQFAATATIFVITGILAAQRFRHLPTARYAAADRI